MPTLCMHISTPVTAQTQGPQATQSAAYNTDLSWFALHFFAEDADGPGQLGEEDESPMGSSDSMGDTSDASEESEAVTSASEGEGTEGGGIDMESDSDVDGASDSGTSDVEDDDLEEGSAGSGEEALLQASLDESSDAEENSDEEGEQ